MFIGRKEQLNDLESLWRKRTSSLVACRGRRRVCQIDLLVQTPRTVYVVEVKRKDIDGGIEKDVEEKMKLLHVRKNVSKRPVLVYDGEISPRVEADGYFAAIIPARKLIGL